MHKMTAQVENIVNAYKTLAKIPAIFNGRLNKAGNRVTSKWSVRNLDKGKSTKYLYNYILNDDLKVIDESEFGTDVSNELLSAVSPNETFKAVVREEKDSKDAKKQYLEVWRRNQLEHCIDLTALDVHGDVYADSEFGCLNWTRDESSVVYVAEKKLQKSEPYIKRKGEEKPKNEGCGDKPVVKGEEFAYRQDWGEQLTGKHLSVVVVCRLRDERVSVLEGLPESWCPGQVCFAPDGQSVYGVAWETEPRRLGLIFCTNRPSFIFNLTLDGKYTTLSPEGMSVRSPRLSPLGGLWWLQRQAGGPHHACHSLVGSVENESKTLVPIIETNIKISNGLFNGIYSQALPKNCFCSDGNKVVFSTPQENEVRTYVVELDSGSIVDISNKDFKGSTSVLDVTNDKILAVCSNMNTPGELYVARLTTPEQDIKWTKISQNSDPPAVVKNSTFEYMHLTHEDSQDSVKSFSALYFAPVASDKKLPLIVWPHGGPHSGFVNAYSLEAALFSMLGFASLQINYRGSTGAGQASVAFLPKRVGNTDVIDCKYATDVAIKQYPIDEKKLCLFGGSHGGFLVTHLSGQYPDLYKVVVSRNPVIDVASMFNSTDIADCVRVNFRGSTGLGDACVRSLIAHVGQYDIQDCIVAMNTCLKIHNLDEKNVFLYGGSYGGFVVAHMAGCYPGCFKAMVCRNPLIDLATKGHYADNYDGCAVEAGYEFSERGAVSLEELVQMRNCSPLAHAHKVRAPTALMLGLADKRVPHYQGLEYARRLKANGVQTRVYMYDDNHSLSSLPAEMDNLINSAKWFLEHL